MMMMIIIIIIIIKKHLSHKVWGWRMGLQDPGLGPEVGSCRNIMYWTFEFHKTRKVYNALDEHTNDSASGA